MRPLDDYSFIRGVCHGMRGDQATLERELGYAQRLQLNSTRIWLRYPEYWADPKGYIERVRNYIRTAHKLGISTMPILWNGNMIDVAILDEDYWPTGERYVTDVVNALKDEEGLIMWDVMNEPNHNDYWRKAPEGEKPARLERFWRFVRHFAAFTKEIDPDNAITVGHGTAWVVEPTVDVVDVISFHDYGKTRAQVEGAYALMRELSIKTGKPLINSELACLCRANPYDMALEICERHRVGWYLFNLIIDGYWSSVHGIVYPDGTIRDPAIVAAIYGFYRKRDLATAVRPSPNREGNATRAIALAEEALAERPSVFQYRRQATEDMLDAAEHIANLLEGCEMVPMVVPPTARIQAWRDHPEEERDIEAIREFTYELAQTLKRWCQIM
ncbi:MAG: cellulase family glycosylhydrolase [Actinobacteria bacterium]|nr:cellulase family glycosylhydrolase [Actinomycetota bacterium]